MTREEAIKGLKVLRRDFSGYKPNEEMFDMAIKAIEQESSGVYKVVEKILFYLNGREKVANDEWVSFEFKELQKFIRECLKEMSIQALSQEPTVTSTDEPMTQKSGKWIYVRDDKYSCSKCGTTTSVDEAGIEEQPMYKYCPYCGARMVEPQESEDKE